jgi:NAD(P)-dependent dehydrogenase (short-subunit alcohol dehydrogenase family)
VSAPTAAGDPGSALVTGANRGLGLALSRELLRRLPGRVLLGVRTADDTSGTSEVDELTAAYPDRAIRVLTDYTDAGSLAATAAVVQPGELRLLVNCGGANVAAGHPRDASKGPVEALSPAALTSLYQVNVVGPVLLCQALWSELTRPGRLVVNISTGRASLAATKDHGSFGYAVTKAALNMATRKLAAELAPHGSAAVAIDPGWVRTRMGGLEAPRTPADAGERLLDVALSAGPELNGRFIDTDGQDLPW